MRALLLRRGRLALLLLVASVALVPLVRADAASLAVTSQALTSHHATSEVPLTTCTVGPAADTDLAEAASTTNYGTSTSLLVRSEALANRRALLRFDLSSCSIPSNAVIRGAALRLTVTSPPAATRTYEVHRATEPWSEGSVTWSTQPAVAASATASAATSTTAGGVIEWSVKTDVEAFVQGTAANEGWRVRDASEGEATAVESALGAREDSTASNRPVLVVTYYP